MSVDLRERLEELVAPPPREGFRQELWEKAESRRRTVAVGRRAAVLALAGIAIAAIGSAGVFALGEGRSATVDRTVSCPALEQGGLNAIALRTAAKGRSYVNGASHPVPAILLVTTGPGGSQLVGVTTWKDGFLVDAACIAAPRIPLARSGLPSAGVFAQNEPGLGNGGNGDTCFVGGHVTIRVRATIRAGTPVAAQLAIRTGKKARPVAFVDWTPKRVTAFVSSDCRDTFR